MADETDADFNPQTESDAPLAEGVRRRAEAEAVSRD